MALHFCAESGNLSCLDQILAADPTLKNAQDEEGYTPLHLAVINGNKDVVRKLITFGADLNCLDYENHSLVHWATGNSYKEKNKNYPLHCAKLFLERYFIRL